MYLTFVLCFVSVCRWRPPRPLEPDIGAGAATMADRGSKLSHILLKPARISQSFVLLCVQEREVDGDGRGRQGAARELCRRLLPKPRFRNRWPHLKPGTNQLAQLSALGGSLDPYTQKHNGSGTTDHPEGAAGATTTPPETTGPLRNEGASQRASTSAVRSPP